MKNLFYVVIAIFMCAGGAYAACIDETPTPIAYTSCRPQYYKSGSDCLACPSMNNTSGTAVIGSSADKNTTGNTGCYMPKCTSTSGGITTLSDGNNVIDGGMIITPSIETCNYFSDASGTYVFTEDCYYKN